VSVRRDELPPTIAPIELGPMPTGRLMTVVDEGFVRAPLERVFDVARDVEWWPKALDHYRYVRRTAGDGEWGGIVEMSANRPFGPLQWPTFWRSEMRAIPPGRATTDAGGTTAPSIRFRHIGGITTGMDVVWEFAREGEGTHVRIVHVWDGPPWPLIGAFAARAVIGPVFVHGIASRTLEGLGGAAEWLEEQRHR
jgi:hypothetical protein